MYIDLVNRIKNAQAAGRRTVRAPYTKIDAAVATLLQSRGFVSKIAVLGRSPKKLLKLALPTRPHPYGFQTLSKPSVARYAGARDLKPVKGGTGLLVVSTTKGVLSGEAARKEGVGGKLLFKIW